MRTFLDKSDLILGIGCSFTETNFGVKMPTGARIIQGTLDPSDINKDIPVTLGVAGDAKLVLQGLLEEVQKLHGKSPKDSKAVAREIADTYEPWLIGVGDLPGDGLGVFRALASSKTSFRLPWW